MACLQPTEGASGISKSQAEVAMCCSSEASVIPTATKLTSSRYNKRYLERLRWFMSVLFLNPIAMPEDCNVVANHILWQIKKTRYVYTYIHTHIYVYPRVRPGSLVSVNIWISYAVLKKIKMLTWWALPSTLTPMPTMKYQRGWSVFE